jgi:hypothetical protein
VAFGPEVREVLFVREPIPVTAGRTVVLDGFHRAAEIRFGKAAVERWSRSRSRPNPEVRQTDGGRAADGCENERAGRGNGGR